MAYNFDKVTTVGKWEIHFDSNAQYGCFEDIKFGGEGGLWFVDNALVDYDGYYELPKPVIEALQSFGLDVTYVTEE